MTSWLKLITAKKKVNSTIRDIKVLFSISVSTELTRVIPPKFTGRLQKSKFLVEIKHRKQGEAEASLDPTPDNCSVQSFQEKNNFECL